VVVVLVLVVVVVLVVEARRADVPTWQPTCRVWELPWMRSVVQWQ